MLMLLGLEEPDHEHFDNKQHYVNMAKGTLRRILLIADKQKTEERTNVQTRIYRGRKPPFDMSFDTDKSLLYGVEEILRILNLNAPDFTNDHEEDDDNGKSNMQTVIRDNNFEEEEWNGEQLLQQFVHKQVTKPTDHLNIEEHYIIDKDVFNNLKNHMENKEELKKQWAWKV
ncbi:10843_t:CDS:2 [Entrophospora sp. SA101]|nr:10843_t:CDS:2 [Entrophospora sp. SA101]